MRRWLIPLLVALLAIACGATRQEKTEAVCDCHRAMRVPDKAFRTFLVDKGYAVKARGSRLKPTIEGCALTELECYNQGICSLEGIEMFPQLQQVTCSDNPITVLDLNALSQLERLYCLNVPLQQLVMDSCHHLRRVQLSHTKLRTLDLTPFPELELLLIIFSPLTEIDLTPCASLKELYMRGTGIREVDLRPCRDFWALHALDTPLDRIVVSPEQYNSDLKVSIADTVQVIVR
ncbi:MAG: hypothetical protein J6X88_01010 [Bacteroidales bacterium]|nr:hypothetical protein [Bacteroidales bacterium]